MTGIKNKYLRISTHVNGLFLPNAWFSKESAGQRYLIALRHLHSIYRLCNHESKRFLLIEMFDMHLGNIS